MISTAEGRTRRHDQLRAILLTSMWRGLGEFGPNLIPRALWITATGPQGLVWRMD